MCVINFNIVTTGADPVAMEGRYRKVNNTFLPWTSFPINMLNQMTPDILSSGSYELQVRVEYANGDFSDWTNSSLFQIGNCSAIGNLYAITTPQECGGVVIGDFTTVLHSSNPLSGTACYYPAVGEIMHKDTDLTVLGDAGVYVIYGSFNGCYPQIRAFTLDIKGTVIDNFFCS